MTSDSENKNISSQSKRFEPIKPCIGESKNYPSARSLFVLRNGGCIDNLRSDSNFDFPFDSDKNKHKKFKEKLSAQKTFGWEALKIVCLTFETATA